MCTMQGLARRWSNTLQLAALDDPGGLLTPHDGAVIVYLPPSLAGQDVQLENATLDWRTEARDRTLRGRPFTCAIFHWVRPGRYAVRCPLARRQTHVTVEAGKLAQLDWRVREKRR